MSIRNILLTKRRKVLAGLVVFTAMILVMPPYHLMLLCWIRGDVSYAGRPVSYWRDQFRDWRLCGWRTLEAVEEKKEDHEKDEYSSKFTYVSDHPGRWSLLCRVTKNQNRFVELKGLKNRLKGWGIDGDPTYGDPFCTLPIFDGDPAAIPVLKVLLKDEDVRIRRLAAAGLGNIGSRGKAAIPALLEAVDRDEDAFLRGVARAAVIDIDKESAKKAGFCESFLFCSPQPKLRATLPGRFILDSPLPFLKDGKILTSGTGEWITIREIATGRALASFQGPAGIGWPIAFSPDGKTVASVSTGKKTVKLWVLATGQELTSMRGHTDEIESLTFSPDGKTLATGSSDKTVRLWHVASGKERNCLQGHVGKIACLAFSPDGANLASGGRSEDKSVKLWNVPTGKERATFQLDPTWGDVRCLAFSPDGKNLACGGGEYEVRLFDVETCKELAKLQGYDDESWVESVAFSPDGKTLASVSLDAIFLWDVTTGKNTAKILSATYPNAATFMPDGKILAVIGVENDHTELWEFAAIANAKK